MADGEWTSEVTVKVSEKLTKELAHRPDIVAQLEARANKIVDIAQIGHKQGDFGVYVQNWPNSKTARAFALPMNGGGIHLELTQSVLIKAVASLK